MTQTHTPWTVGAHGDVLRVWDAKRSGVADICIRRNINDAGPSATEKEYARLIAAAPMLLKECKRLVAYVGASGIADDPRNTTLEPARAAIKAATEG